jgi:hypothetical protein
MLRYDFKLSTRKFGQWSRVEDEVLIKFVDEFGEKWAKIGEMIGTYRNY